VQTRLTGSGWRLPATLARPIATRLQRPSSETPISIVLSQQLGADRVVVDAIGIQAFQGWQDLARSPIRSSTGVTGQSNQPSVQAVVLAQSGSDIATTIRFANTYGLTWRIRGGGTEPPRVSPSLKPKPQALADLLIVTTGMTGAIDISRTRRSVRALAGTTLDALSKALTNEGLALPLHFDCPGTATLGGLIATNAHGVGQFGREPILPRMLGLEAVGADGTLLTLNRLNLEAGVPNVVGAMAAGVAMGRADIAALTEIELAVVRRRECARAVLAFVPTVGDAVTMAWSAPTVACGWMRGEIFDPNLVRAMSARRGSTDPGSAERVSKSKSASPEPDRAAILFEFGGDADEIDEAHLVLSDHVVGAGGTVWSKADLARFVGRSDRDVSAGSSSKSVQAAGHHLVAEPYASLGLAYPHSLVEARVSPALLAQCLEALASLSSSKGGSDDGVRIGVRASPWDGALWITVRAQEGGNRTALQMVEAQVTSTILELGGTVVEPLDRYQTRLPETAPETSAAPEAASAAETGPRLRASDDDRAEDPVTMSLSKLLGREVGVRGGDRHDG